MIRTVIDILESLEATTKRLEKEAILQDNIDNQLLKRVLVATFDPYVNYGLRKIKAKTSERGEKLPIDEDEYLENWMNLLENELATRNLSGNSAKVAAQTQINRAAVNSPRLGIWFERILLKNLRVGVQEKTINKIWPGSVTPFAVQLATSLEANTLNGNVDLQGQVVYPVVIEPKLDGLRLIAVKNNGQVSLFTRNGTKLDTLPELVRDLESCPIDNFVLDGEGCAAGDQSVAWNESASVMMSSKNHKNAGNIRYNVFDYMTFNEWTTQACKPTLMIRRAGLEELMRFIPGEIVVLVPQAVVNSDGELLQLYEKFLDIGYEGVMVKDVKGQYEFKRTDAMRKLKPVSTYEGSIVGWYEGKLGTKREGLFGGFSVLLPNGETTNVGSGFSDALKSEIWANGPATYLGKIVECAAQPPLTSDGKMRFPRLKRFRDPGDVDPLVTETYLLWKERHPSEI